MFAKGDAAEAAKAAGADEVGADELAKKIKEGWTDFDACIAAPDMMGLVGPLGKVLGPRGLMPSPRAGTVTPDVAKTVKEYKAGKVEFRNDAGGIVHAVVGKLSFDDSKLAENIQAFIDHIHHLKPHAVKGQYIKIDYCQRHDDAGIADRGLAAEESRKLRSQMSKLVKNLLIDDLRNRLQGVNDCLLVNVIGLNSEKTSKLRAELRKKDIRLQVIKNSMARRATEGTPLAPAFEGAEGTLAVVWGGEDVVSLAKIVMRLAEDKAVPGSGGARRRY